MENEPEDVLNIRIDGKPFEVNRFNTSIFTFIGSNAIKDHVFLAFEPTETGAMGTHIWEYFQEEAYLAIAGVALEYDYPMHLNLNEIAECDEDAWEAAIKASTTDVGDFIPDDFKLGDGNGTTETNTN